MHHLVVADGQHEMFAERVEKAERHLIVVACAEQRVRAHIAEHVVHPAHVPLEVEAQASLTGGMGHQRPRGALLRDEQRAGFTFQHGGVQLLQKSNGLQVLVVAVDVWLPFAVAPVVIQVQHAGHGIYTQAVDVILRQPEQCVGDQKALYLGPGVIEHHRAPFLVLGAQRVLILITVGAVELVQPELVFREVGGYPVHNDADAGPMAFIHKCLEIRRRAVAAGGGEIARHLIAPAPVERIFHQGHQLHVGIAHVRQVGNKLPRKRPVVKGVPVRIGPPTARVHLINVHGTVQRVPCGSALLPCVIRPVVAILQRVHLAAVRGACFRMEGVRVCFEYQLVRRCSDAVFVDIKLPNAGDETLPDASLGIDIFHRSGRGDPAVEIPHHGDGLGARRPNTEHHAFGLAHVLKMRAEKTLALEVIPLLE